MAYSVLSYNIWDIPILNPRKTRERVEKIAEFIRHSNFDVICLQECFGWKNREFLRRQLADVYQMTEPGGRRKAFFLLNFDTTGGLVIFSKHPILTSKFLPFNRFLNSSLPEFFPRKGFLDAVIRTPTGNLRVVNIHFHQPSWFFDRKIRLYQLSRILRFLKSETDPLPTIIAGDFNEHDLANQKSFLNLLSRSGFTYSGKGKKLLPTYRPENPYVNNILNRIKQALTFDYIFLKDMDRLGLGVGNYKPIYLDPPLSDHDPVLLELSLLTNNQN